MESTPESGRLENVAARLAPLTVSDPEGREMHFDELWRERPVVMVFLRHFG